MTHGLGDGLVTVESTRLEGVHAFSKLYQNAELADAEMDHVVLTAPDVDKAEFNNHFFDELYLKLLNDNKPRSRPMYRIETSSGRAYWILTPGR